MEREYILSTHTISPLVGGNEKTEGCIKDVETGTISFADPTTL